MRFQQIAGVNIHLVEPHTIDAATPEIEQLS